MLFLLATKEPDSNLFHVIVKSPTPPGEANMSLRKRIMVDADKQ
jgi:hypothetical protein